MVHALKKLTIQGMYENYDSNTQCGKCNKVPKKELKEEI